MPRKLLRHPALTVGGGLGLGATLARGEDNIGSNHIYYYYSTDQDGKSRHKAKLQLSSCDLEVGRGIEGLSTIPHPTSKSAQFRSQLRAKLSIELGPSWASNILV
ncbi:hypothetical protein C8F04DRAFT_1180769 [Mycena alexandri]|uniref:Uncharacterized protein n=1 Tax=Mycena alexandri TaxID=1745969 RepID=A0AAD6X569_9AGAR|nr:hypothetical protein C8F04DRAFT_1180769 [Mycena alexandri]